MTLQKESEANQRLMTTDIATLVKEATAPGSTSLAVHDHHLEKLTQDMWKEYFQRDTFKFERWDKPYQLRMAQIPAQLGAILAQLGGAPTAGQTTVNNVTVAPSSSNSISSVSKSENTYGTVDPYTSAVGAYG